MEKKLYLGVAREDITPPLGTQLYGYGDWLFSKEVHDALSVTAYVFKAEQKKVVLISATVCLIHTNLADRIRNEVAKMISIPVENCILSATHTHSGPNTAAEPGCGELDAEYCEEIFVPKVLKAVWQAKQHMVQVQMGVATGKSYVGINRRELKEDNSVILGQNEWAPIDLDMTVLSFRDETEKIVGNIIHYGAHGTSAGANEEITRDWSGVMTDRLENITGGKTAFFNGPEGDIGPRLSNGGTMGTIMHTEELGNIAAEDAIRIFEKIDIWKDADLHIYAGEIHIPLKKEGMPFHDVPQSIVSIGDVTFVSFPYELFTEIGMRIKKASGLSYVLPLSNTNGSEGYFVTEDQICRGGYEVGEYQKAPYSVEGEYLYDSHADWHLVKSTLDNLKRRTIR